MKAKTSSGLRKWRAGQRRGAIMKPRTFAAIARKSGTAIAGFAYWQAAKAKYRARKKH